MVRVHSGLPVLVYAASEASAVEKRGAADINSDNCCLCICLSYEPPGVSSEVCTARAGCAGAGGFMRGSAGGGPGGGARGQRESGLQPSLWEESFSAQPGQSGF